LGPADLHEVLSKLPEIGDPRLLVGPGTFDDAGVVRLSDELALVQTVDFFTPVVDDAFDFGRIAAANALSDVYAMGAKPFSALAICAFPIETLPLEVLRETLAGGLTVLREEGVLPLGGHTIKGPEFTYGLAVTGLVHPDKVLTNAGAKVGDVLVLTKAIGTGVLATALKRGVLGEAERKAMIASMVATNRAAFEACEGLQIHALTDVTGYGLLGHGLEMAEASGVRIEIDAPAVPLLPGARAAVEGGSIPAGLVANRSWVAGKIEMYGVDDVIGQLLCDPQTSGGLLAAIAPEDVESYSQACRQRGVAAAVIGRVVVGSAGTEVIRGGLG
jgi:selenide,water dikinase